MRRSSLSLLVALVAVAAPQVLRVTDCRCAEACPLLHPGGRCPETPAPC